MKELEGVGGALWMFFKMFLLSTVILGIIYLSTFLFKEDEPEILHTPDCLIFEDFTK